MQIHTMTGNMWCIPYLPALTLLYDKTRNNPDAQKHCLGIFSNYTQMELKYQWIVYQWGVELWLDYEGAILINLGQRNTLQLFLWWFGKANAWICTGSGAEWLETLFQHSQAGERDLCWPDWGLRFWEQNFSTSLGTPWCAQGKKSCLRDKSSISHRWSHEKATRNGPIIRDAVRNIWLPSDTFHPVAKYSVTIFHSVWKFVKTGNGF